MKAVEKTVLFMILFCLFGIGYDMYQFQRLDEAREIKQKTIKASTNRDRTVFETLNQHKKSLREMTNLKLLDTIKYPKNRIDSFSNRIDPATPYVTVGNKAYIYDGNGNKTNKFLKKGDSAYLGEPLQVMDTELPRLDDFENDTYNDKTIYRSEFNYAKLMKERNFRTNREKQLYDNLVNSNTEQSRMLKSTGKNKFVYIPTITIKNRQFYCLTSNEYIRVSDVALLYDEPLACLAPRCEITRLSTQSEFSKAGWSDYLPQLKKNCLTSVYANYIADKVPNLQGNLGINVKLNKDERHKARIETVKDDGKQAKYVNLGDLPENSAIIYNYNIWSFENSGLPHSDANWCAPRLYVSPNNNTIKIDKNTRYKHIKLVVQNDMYLADDEATPHSADAFTFSVGDAIDMSISKFGDHELDDYLEEVEADVS